MLLELTIGGLLLLAYKKSEKKGVLTPARQEAYEKALVNLTDPDKLRELADSYEKESLPVEADMLRRRADLRGQSPEQKAARKVAFDKGMKSTDIAGIERLADAFESLTATGAASSLRQRVAALRASPPKVENEFEPAAGGSLAEDPGFNPGVKDFPASPTAGGNPGVKGAANGAANHKKNEKPVIDTTAESVE